VQVQRRAEEASKTPAAASNPAAASTTPAPAAPAGAPPETAAAPRLEGAGLVQPDEVAAMRADAVEQLKALAAPPEGADAKAPDPTAKLASKALQDVLLDRQQKLDDHDKVSKGLKELAKPENDPVRQLAEANEEAARMAQQMQQPVEGLLPEAFRTRGDVDEATRGQMKEAIEATKKDVEDYQSKLRDSNPEPVKEAAKAVAALRADRDKLTQRLAALKTRAQGKAQGPAPDSQAERKLEAEKATNLRLELTVETLRAKALELKIERTIKAAEAEAARRAVWIAHSRFGQRLLKSMQERFSRISQDDANDLTKLADAEEKKAEKEEDPLRRYQAGRTADLLKLEAEVVNYERVLAAGAGPSPQEQSGLVGKAAANLERIKGILGEGRLTEYDVLLLNADYREIGPQRDRIRRNELAEVQKLMRDFTNALTSAELELIEDSMVDQVERDALMESLPPQRRNEADRVAAKLEDRHHVLLTRRRDALRKLVESTSETLGSINRRLALLEEEYAYIRTHLVWIRDQEPVSLSTFARAASELHRRVVPGLIKLAEETANPGSWRRTTPEFLAAGLLALTLPIGIFRLRSVVKRRLIRALPPSQRHGDASRPVAKVDADPAPRQGGSGDEPASSTS
jgi:potassium efflux system protein